jgi:amino acid transporter
VLTIFAVANTALINYVMGSRLLYGLASQGLAPAPLGRVHPRRRTPHVAIAALLVVVISLALIGEIGQLAAATVLLLLMVFIVVNIGLVRLTLREGRIEGAFNVPAVIPILAAAICGVLLVVRVARTDWAFFTAEGGDVPAPVIAGVLFVLIAILYLATGKGRAERIAAYWAREENANG